MRQLVSHLVSSGLSLYTIITTALALVNGDWGGRSARKMIRWIIFSGGRAGRPRESHPTSKYAKAALLPCLLQSFSALDNFGIVTDHKTGIHAYACKPQPAVFVYTAHPILPNAQREWEGFPGELYPVFKVWRPLAKFCLSFSLLRAKQNYPSLRRHCFAGLCFHNCAVSPRISSL